MNICMAIENSEVSVLVVSVEPWAEEYEVHTGQQIVIEFGGDGEGIPLIDRSDGRLVIYGWPGATVSVTRNGAELSSAGSINAPSVPR
jgi:hypothetical protein